MPTHTSIQPVLSILAMATARRADAHDVDRKKKTWIEKKKKGGSEKPSLGVDFSPREFR
jgi:hypothetical protein